MRQGFWMRCFFPRQRLRDAEAEEYLSGLTDMETIAGSEHIVPAQAIVMILGFSSFLPQLTMTAELEDKLA